MLPQNLALTERAAVDFRQWLIASNCGDWTIFHTGDDELYDVDRYLQKLDPDAQWHPAEPLTGMGELPVIRNSDADASLPGHGFVSGFLMLRDLGVAVARWYWIDPEYNAPDSLWILASREDQSYLAVRDRIRKLRHSGNMSVWQIVRGSAGHDGPRIRRRKNAGRELVVSEDLQKQVDRDVLGFFKPEVKRLYKKLDVPYRRGVLLYGPPGNGKTSLIRMLGAKLPRVPFLLVRPDRAIDARALRSIIDRWQKQAPAVLVIEDLNWLLEHVDVSQFLNLLDGVERPSAKGLLLLATTNYPERLDPAVNNRPGRFDVVIDMPNPNRALRERFVQQNLDTLAEDEQKKVVEQSDGLSFSHLREILRLSGLIAIDMGRDERSGEDVLTATDLVRNGHDLAIRGFPKPPEVPFGLQHTRRK